MSRVIEARFEVVTPLFCAGADPKRAELRLPSFKGVLRFWWRALAWSRLNGDLNEIQSQESEIFGSADGGQSRVRMRLVVNRAPVTVTSGQVLTKTPRGDDVVGQGARYLGYGVMEAFARCKKKTQAGQLTQKKTQAGQLTRSCLRAPIDFTVSLQCRDLDNAALDSVRDALKALGLLGGMGAKSRKGYGSLVLKSLKEEGKETWSAPESLDGLQKAIQGLLKGAREDLPDYTALSADTRFVLLTADARDPLVMLDLIGREMVRYRSWGQNGKILGGGIPSEMKFKDDHDLMKMDAPHRHAHPRRIAFGLPHNYYGKRNDQQVRPHDARLDRRASPLFIHVHQWGDTPVAVLAFLPARFLPKDRSAISVGGTTIALADEAQLYEPIVEFLDRLLTPGQRKEHVTHAIEVKP